MKQFIILALSAILSGCAGDSIGVLNPTVAPPSAPTGLDLVVSEYNEQRAAMGQELIQPGLACSLYTVPNTTTQIVGASLTGVGSWGYSGDFNIANGPSSPGLSLLPPTLQGIYTSYYVVKCYGLYVNAVSDFYGFNLSSDDGANLYLYNLTINNDGAHAISTKSGATFIPRGVVGFELDFFDIGGSHALMLYSGGIPVGSEHFYH